jgi:hypothetical protein
MEMHPLFLLAFATFIVVIAFLIWSRMSATRHRPGRRQTGVGGPADPISGANPEIRDPDVLRANLDHPSRP